MSTKKIAQKKSSTKPSATAIEAKAAEPTREELAQEVIDLNHAARAIEQRVDRRMHYAEHNALDALMALENLHDPDNAKQSNAATRTEIREAIFEVVRHVRHIRYDELCDLDSIGRGLPVVAEKAAAS